MTIIEEKTTLTERETVIAYLLNRHHGVSQHLIALAYGINPGRVAEAILAVEYAVQNTLKVYGLWQMEKNNDTRGARQKES